MRLNTRGDALGRGHVNGTPLPDIGGTDYCWLTDDVPICAAGNTIQKYEHNAWSVVEPHGANFLRAGRTRHFTERTVPGWAPTDVDPYDGTAVLTHYDIGHDLRLIAMDGSVKEIATGVLGRDAIAYHNVRQRGGWLLYQESGSWRLMSAPAGMYTPIASRLEFVDYAVPVAFEGRAMLLERANGRLSLRRPDTTLGWLVHEDAASDGLVVPDAIALADQIRVTWSDKQSEAASVFQVRDVTLDPATRIDLNAQQLPPIEAIPLINRVFGVCVYSFHDATIPGQILLPIRPSERQWGQPIVLPSDRADLAEGNYIWAVYAGENAALTYEKAIQSARPLGDSLQRGLLAYKDSYPLPTSTQLEDYDIAGCLLKRGPNESIDAFKARCRAESGEWPSIHLADTELRAAETLTAACEIANEGRWIGFSVFAAGRPDVPWHVIEPRLQRFMLGVTGMPPPRIIPDDPEVITMPYAILKKQTPGEPVVNVVKLTEEQKDGKLFLNYPDGKKLSMQSDGTIGDRPHDTYGPWEEFIKTGKGYVSSAHGEKYGIVTL